MHKNDCSPIFSFQVLPFDNFPPKVQSSCTPITLYRFGYLQETLQDCVSDQDNDNIIFTVDFLFFVSELWP